MLVSLLYALEDLGLRVGVVALGDLETWTAIAVERIA
jgi:hypothetical protein